VIPGSGGTAECCARRLAWAYPAHQAAPSNVYTCDDARQTDRHRCFGLPSTEVETSAIKALAAKLARLVYRMLRYAMQFVDKGAEFYEAQHRKLQINHLKWKADELGFQLIEAPAA